MLLLSLVFQVQRCSSHGTKSQSRRPVFLQRNFLHTLSLLTHICLWWGREERERGGRGERQGNHHTPFWDGQAPIIHSSTPSSFSEWGLIIGPLCCVWILRLHTLSQTVSGHQTDGVCMQTHTHTYACPQTHTYIGLVRCSWHTPMPDPSHAPLKKRKKKKEHKRRSLRSPLPLDGGLTPLNQRLWNTHNVQ